jgi:hypothetical protein
MTPTELERLASIETLLGEMNKTIDAIKDQQRCYTHSEQINGMRKSMTGLWALNISVGSLFIGGLIKLLFFT